MLIKIENSFTTGQEIFVINEEGKWAKAHTTGSGKYAGTVVNDTVDIPVKGAIRATWREVGHYGQSTQIVRVEAIGEVPVDDSEILAIVGAEDEVTVVRQ